MTMTIKHMMFDDLNDLPNLVYKYRTWKDQYHQSILSDQTVYMAPATSFEDKKDCKILKRFDLITNEEIYAKYYSFSKKEHPTWTEPEHEKFAKECFEKSPLHDKELTAKNQLNYFHEFDKRFGVLSLTANQLNNDMWEKYSDNYTGFCVGFHAKPMFKFLGGGGDVTYYDVLPDILPSHDFDTERALQVFSKEKKWEFEQEYRTHIFRPDPLTKEDRCIKLPKECYKQVLFGMSISAGDMAEIIDICKKQELKIDYYKAIKLESGEVIQEQL